VVIVIQNPVDDRYIPNTRSTYVGSVNDPVIVATSSSSLLLLSSYVHCVPMMTTIPVVVVFVVQSHNWVRYRNIVQSVKSWYSNIVLGKRYVVHIIHIPSPNLSPKSGIHRTISVVSVSSIHLVVYWLHHDDVEYYYDCYY
jgi:hypothetical protein